MVGLGLIVLALGGAPPDAFAAEPGAGADPLGPWRPGAGPYGGRGPARASRFWRALPAPTARGDANLVVLRPAIQRKVRVRGARFIMGSSPSDMLAAIALCEREPLGGRCATSSEIWDPAPSLRAEGHIHEATVGDFDLDRTEVTVAAYARCAAAGACAAPGFPTGDPRYDRPDFPVTHVAWDAAADYCTWIGGRLPTEAEWELAARGPARRTFPWGNAYNPRLSNHGSLADDTTDGRDGFLGLAPVGSFPDGATPSGLLDMAGNVAEWVVDFYDRDEDGYGYPRRAEVNPTGGPFSAFGHVARGGSYRDGGFRMRGASRFAWPLAAREIGFRCAYDVLGAVSPVDDRPDAP